MQCDIRNYIEKLEHNCSRCSPQKALPLGLEMFFCPPFCWTSPSKVKRRCGSCPPWSLRKRRLIMAHPRAVLRFSDCFGIQIRCVSPLPQYTVANF